MEVFWRCSWARGWCWPRRAGTATGVPAGADRRERITTVHFVPSMLDAFLSTAGPADRTHCRSLRRIVCSGEELAADLARRAVAAIPVRRAAQPVRTHRGGDRRHRLGGHTRRADRRDPGAVGGPIRNVRTYVLDAAMRPVPAGVAGHLHLGGVQVARGYLNRPGLTAGSFVPTRSASPAGGCTPPATWPAGVPTGRWSSSAASTTR
ncbi:AMP-binding protein [Micromonospora sp. b486]|uniref:AMP-binding protein n=1 Tax=Micromonospora sp. b486 TaxID=3053986 RepID=UPI00259CF240|nr:AMP-binding protein [Micromonospora sp. b486]MDM4784702.1 AMP-binding protein [Micromonospora sp. b486]